MIIIIINIIIIIIIIMTMMMTMMMMMMLMMMMMMPMMMMMMMMMMMVLRQARAWRGRPGHKTDTKQKKHATAGPHTGAAGPGTARQARAQNGHKKQKTSNLHRNPPVTHASLSMLSPSRSHMLTPLAEHFPFGHPPLNFNLHTYIHTYIHT